MSDADAQAPAPIEGRGWWPEIASSWRERSSRVLLYALSDYPALTMNELSGLNVNQLTRLARAASQVKMFAEDLIGEKKTFELIKELNSRQE